MAYEIIETVSNGDCLFDSIRIILQSIDIMVRAQDLRETVAYAMIGDAEALEYYLSLHRDAKDHSNYELLEETQFMKNIKAAEPRVNNPRILKALLDRSLYWGDTYAVNFFTQKLGIEFIVMLAVPGKPYAYKMHALLNKGKSSHYAILSLQYKHYRPISVHGQFIFTFPELPEMIRHKIRKSLSPR